MKNKWAIASRPNSTMTKFFARICVGWFGDVTGKRAQ